MSLFENRRSGENKKAMTEGLGVLTLPTSAANGVLFPMDVLLAIDGQPIGNDGVCMALCGCVCVCVRACVCVWRSSGFGKNHQNFV